MSILDRDTLNAFCRHNHVELDGAEKGPLASLCFAAKDIYDIAGHKTGFGSPDWLDSHPPAIRTATVVQRLLDAGARLVGKTHTDELTYSLTGENTHYGTPVNPNAPERIPGGSSSGSAAAVAGGLVDFALGSDTGGSIRAPASFCGIYGFRPSHGRVSLEGACPLARSFDTAGWFARDADLLQRVGEILLESNSSPSPPGQLWLAQDAFALVNAEAIEALQPAVTLIEKVLGKAQPVVVSPEGLPHWFQAFRILQGAEIWAEHGEWVHRVQPRLGPGIRERMQWASTVENKDIETAHAQRRTTSERVASLLEGNQILLLPTVPGIAPLRHSPSAVLDDFRGKAMSLLCIAGLARLPQVSLPLATLQGCPLGISLIAKQGNDELLLRVAVQIADYCEPTPN